ncbi:MAG: SDR family NAD(P)-dependent oxidoreductase [Candidatus Woesearchaeota archaeon]|nr:SDR family NAD(P)-dependent oxidoreductase [Candidatus Woesearchaeota archaeon]
MADGSVLITGSSKGLGESLAIIFSRDYQGVILHGRDIQDLQRVRQRILESNRGKDVLCKIVQGDLTDSLTLERLAEAARGNDVSVLINNAAIISKGYVSSFDEKEISYLLNVNLVSAIKLTGKIYPHLAARGGGMIININSKSGLNPEENNSLYSASKYGMKGFTDCLRMDAKKDNIRVIGVYPAGMHTSFHNSVGGHSEIEKTMRPEEVAEIVYRSTCYNSVHINDIILERAR